jgi:hypothetical protein
MAKRSVAECAKAFQIAKSTQGIQAKIGENDKKGRIVEIRRSMD